MADGKVVFEADLNTDGLKSSLQGVEKSASDWSKNIGKFFSFSAISAGLVKLAQVGVGYNIEMEKYATNFSVMLGSEAAAIEHVAELREMAAKTPFGMNDLANASQTMLSFGLGAEESMVAMQQLGDISLGNKERFNSLSLAFAQVSAAGKLTGQDLLQMVNAGFNPLQTIAEKTGTNLGDLKEVMAGGKGSKEFRKQLKAAQKEVKKMGENASEGAKWLVQLGEEGAISAEMVGKAMAAETGEGGRFFNGMEKASQTISGLWSTLQDETAALAGNILEPVTNTLGKGVLKAANTVVGALNSLFDEDGEIEINAEIAAAQANLTTLDTDIQNLKQKYITETISINIKADEANTLLDRLAELQSIDKEFLTEADKQEMQTLSAQLVAINPELQKFVGKDGIIRKDVEAVRELTTNYLELAKAQARAAYAADVQARVEQARINLGVASEQLTSLKEQREALGKTSEEWQTYKDSAMDAAVGLAQNYGGNNDAALKYAEQSLGVIAALSKDKEAFAFLSENFDLSKIFNLEDMSLKSPEELLATTESMVALLDVVKGLAGFAGSKEGADTELAAAIDAQIAAAEAAVAEGTETLEKSIAELDALLAYFESSDAGGEGNKTGTNEAAKTKGKSMAAAVGEGYAEGEDALAAEIDAVNQRVLKKVGEKRTRHDKGGDGQEDAAAGVSGLGKAVIDELSTGIEEGAATLSSDITGVLTTAKSSADTSQFKNVGYQITSGMAAGVRSGSGLLSAAVIAVVENALAAAQRAAQIRSPSRLFRDEVGAMIAAGTAEGVTMGAGQLRTAVANMVNTSIPDMSRVGTQIMSASAGRTVNAAMAAAMGAGNFTQTNNFNVPVQTPDEFAKTMRLYATYGLQG